MLSKSNIKTFVAGSICAAVVTTGVIGFASSGVQKSISVFYNNVKLVVDGKTVSLGKDSSGKNVEPFIHNGTTYLPVRAVGEALSKEVNWDGKTQTVYIGAVPGQAQGEAKYITEVLEAVGASETYKLENKEKLNMGGKNYNTGYKKRVYSGDFIYFNLDGQYTEVEGEIGTLEANQSPFDLDIYLDDKLYKTIKMSGETAPQKLTFSVSGVNQIKFKTEKDYNSLGLGDFTIK